MMHIHHEIWSKRTRGCKDGKMVIAVGQDISDHVLYSVLLYKNNELLPGYEPSGPFPWRQLPADFICLWFSC